MRFYVCDGVLCDFSLVKEFLAVAREDFLRKWENPAQVRGRLVCMENVSAVFTLAMKVFTQTSPVPSCGCVAFTATHPGNISEMRWVTWTVSSLNSVTDRSFCL